MSTSNLVILGIVTAGNLKGPLGGVLVSAHISGAPKPLSEGLTNQLGEFRIVLEAGRPLALAGGARISFSVRTSRRREPIFSSKPIALIKLPKGHVRLHVPEASLVLNSQKPSIRLMVDEQPARNIEIGQTISLSGAGLYPSAQFEIYLAIDGSEPLTQSVISNSFGQIELATILPQFGLWGYDSDRPLTIEQAQERFGGRTLEWNVLHRKKSVARGKLAISREISRPVAFVSDKEGRLRNAIEYERDDLFLTITQEDALEVYKGTELLPRFGRLLSLSRHPTSALSPRCACLLLVAADASAKSVVNTPL